MGLEILVGTFEHIQSASSTTWTITHNLGLTEPCVDFWIDVAGTDTKILPVSVIATSDKVVTATFSSAQSGRALVA